MVPVAAAIAAAAAAQAYSNYKGGQQQAQSADQARAAQERAAAQAAASSQNAALQAQGQIVGAQGAQEQALASGYGGAAGAVGGYGDLASSLLAGYGGEARGAIGSALDLYGQGFNDFEADPGYQFRLQQGEQAINRSAAARGGRLGGETLKELAGYGQGLASQEFGNYAQRQMGLMGAQSGLYGQLAGLYGSEGSQLANLSTGIGSQLAGLGTGQGTALANIYGTNAANVGSALTGAAGSQVGLAQSMIPQYTVPTQYAGYGPSAIGNAAQNFGTNLLYANMANSGGGGVNTGIQEPPPGYALA